MPGEYSPPTRLLENHSPRQSLVDPVFGPQPGFNFENGEDADPNESGPGIALNDQQSFFNLFDANDLSFGGREDYSFPASSDSLSQDVATRGHTLDPTNIWNRTSSPSICESGNKFAPRPYVVQNCTTSLLQPYSQTTPPQNPIDEMLLAKRAKSDLSERARYAANQRHAKSRKLRKSSVLSQSSSISDNNNREDTRERYREKNRLAAAKCRGKRKERIMTIEDKYYNLSALNNVLKKQFQELRDELSGLRAHALGHQDCNCLISKYNGNQARKMAMGVDKEGSLNFSGYPQGHASLPTVGAATLSPNMGVLQQQNQCFAAPLDYASALVTTSEGMDTMAPGSKGDSKTGELMQQSSFGHQGGFL